MICKFCGHETGFPGDHYAVRDCLRAIPATDLPGPHTEPVIDITDQCGDEYEGQGFGPVFDLGHQG